MSLFSVFATMLILLPVFGGVYADTASGTSADPGAAPSTDSGPGDILEQGSQLCIFKVDNVDVCIYPEEYITYTLQYSNSGQSQIFNVSMLDYLPPDTEFDSATGTYVYDPGPPATVSWDIGTLGPFESGSYQLVVVVKAGTAPGTALVDSVRLFGDFVLSKRAVNTVMVCCEVSGPDPVCPGDQVQYCGPEGMLSYAWQVSGGAVIVGPANQRCVTVQTGLDCMNGFDLTLDVVAPDGSELVCARSVTITDDEDPEITCPPTANVQCPSEIPPPNPDIVGTDDNCGPVTVTWEGDESDNQTCPETITRTYRATDACGNYVECEQLIIVNDTTDPEIISCPGTVNVQCPGDEPPHNTSLVDAYDNCGQVTVTWEGDESDNQTCPETITRTYRATDACGNYTECQQLIIVHDTTKPTITCPPDFGVQCAADVPPPNTGLVTADDNCGPPTVTWEGDQTVPGTPPEVHRTYRATDACGNWRECVQKITIDDTEDPQISCPDDADVQCPGQVPPPNIDDVTASDNCGDVTITWEGDESDGGSCPETITRTYRATDAAGNFAECQQIITVDDTQNPQITSCPGRVDVQCQSDVPAPDIGLVAATDNCGPPTITWEGDQSDNQTCPETITRTYRATDACGNWVECTQLIVVDDTQPPTLDCADDKSVVCGPIEFDDPDVDDNCDPNPVLNPGQVTETPGPGPGEITYTKCWTATDACGNVSAECCQSIFYSCIVPPELDKEDDVATCVTPGESFTCTIDYSNPNDSELTGVVLTDQMPLEVSFVGATGGGVYDGGNRVTWNIGVLGANASGQVELTMAVDPQAPPVVARDTCALSTNEASSVFAYEDTWICDEPPCIEIRIPDIIVSPNEDILIPLIIGDVTGYMVMGFEIKVCWCDIPAGLLQFEGYCLPGEAITASQDWMVYCSACEPYCITVVGAGAYPLATGGVLAYMGFHVSANAKPGMCCAFEIPWAHVYDDERLLEVCPEGGIICVDACEVFGWVKHWKCCADECDNYDLNMPLVGASVHVSDCHGPIETILTDGNGEYRFEDLPPIEEACPYCVDVDLCPEMAECVTAFDASLILQYLTAMNDLTECPFEFAGATHYPQRLAADVNCTAQLTGEDASLVLRYVVGLISEFPCPNIWRFYPLGGDNCVEECPGELNWVGIRMGDVSGCIECPDGLLAAGSVVYARLGQPREEGTEVVVPVVVEGGGQVMSVEVDLSFDTGQCSILGVGCSGVTEGFMAFHNTVGDRVYIGMASGSSAEADGEICALRLQPGAGFELRDLGGLRLERVLLNEGNPRVHIVRRGQFQEDLELGPISPNPFAQGTSITFKVPSSCRVTLGIYNVEGQLVRLITDQAVGKGSHTEFWDGCDDSGARVSRGVYFCRMETEGFEATQKVVLLK
jgi:uncharacterized repeat protein (TIGR01451 family)